MVEVNKPAPTQNSIRALPTSGVASKKDMEGKKETDGENGVGVLTLDEEDRERKRRGGGGEDGRGERQGRSEDRDSTSTRSGIICCDQGRVWIFLVLGVLTLVFSAVLIGIYMNMRTLTSSMHLVEVMPSYIPAVVGGVAALSVLLLFWRRSKPLMYLVLLLCAAATVICIVTAVLTGTKILNPILSAEYCGYTRITRTCKCTIKNEDSATATSKSAPSSYLVMKDVVGCSVIEDILPNMLFTVVGIYGVIALVCTINGLISLLVCRMELNRKRLQSADYGADYSSSPTSSSESFMEQQTMLPSHQLHQSGNSTSHPSAVAVNSTTSAITSASSCAANPLANIYTNANAIDDVNAINDGSVTSPGGVPYNPSYVPIGETGPSQMKRSRSFSQPRRSTVREGSPQSSSSTASQAPSSVLGGASDEERRLIPKRRKTRRAVTLHGLDREQLMLILSLQMRYLQETDQDSKKPEGYAVDNVNTSSNDIPATGPVPNSPSSSESSDEPSAIKPAEVKRASSMKDVVSGNLNAIRLSNQAFVGSGHMINETALQQQSAPVQNPELYDSAEGNSAFMRMQRRAMTPTPRQERLSSCRTTDDEMEFQQSPKRVRSHTPQPHHFRSEQQAKHQQQVLQEQQRQQYLLDMQQEYQYWSLQQQIQQEQLQNQQQQIQELQFLNMRQKQELLLQQQQQQVEMQQQQQIYNGLPPQQHPLNEQYHQIIQQQLRQAPYSGVHSETLSSSTLDNNDVGPCGKTDVADDEPPTHITIDLRDITKTGPVIYENAPPPKIASLMSHTPSNPNSVSSVSSAASTLRGLSSSPQPKSILINRAPKVPPQIANQRQHADLQAAMMRQVSNTSTQSLLSSSGTGSISSEIQNAFGVVEQPVLPSADVTSNDPKDGDKNEDGKMKWTKKLSMKLKRDKKDKDKDTDKINNKGKLLAETEEKTAEVENDGKPQTSSGLARSDSDIRRSGVFPDRWQAIMVDSAVQQTPQTLWENVQRKIVADPEEQPARVTNPPPYPGKSQPIYSNANRSAPEGIVGNAYPSESNYAYQNGTRKPALPEPNQAVMSPPNPLYSNAAPSLRPGIPMGDNPHFQGQHVQQSAISAGRPFPPQQPLPKGSKSSDNTFVPISTSSHSTFSDDHAIEDRPSSKPNLRRSNSLVDPNAPPKPPRLPINQGEALADIQGQPQRPRSYVKAVTKDAAERSPRATSSNNSSISGEDVLASGAIPRSTAVRMHMEGVRSEFGGEIVGDKRTVIGSDAYPIPMKYNGDQGQFASHYVNPNPKDTRGHPLSPRQQQRPMPVPQVVGDSSRFQANQDPMTNKKFYPFNGTPYPSQGHAICDTDLDDLPVFRPGKGRYQVQSSFSPPAYAPPPIYRSMESVARHESIRSTSSSSSEPQNTSCTLSEPHNTSYTLSEPHNTSSDCSFTPPLRPEFQRSRSQIQGGVPPQGIPRGRPIQARGRNLSLGSRYRASGSRFTYRSATAARTQDAGTSPLSPTPLSPQGQSAASEPYVLMRRCQSVEDRGRNHHANFDDAYLAGPWPKSRNINNNINNNNNNSINSSSSSNGVNSDDPGFSPDAVEARRHYQNNTAFFDPNHNNGNLRKSNGPKKTNQERDIRPIPQGSEPAMLNFQPTLGGSHMNHSFPVNPPMSPSNGNLPNGPMSPSRHLLDHHNPGRIGPHVPSGFVSDNPASSMETMGVSWDSIDDNIINRPLRKLTLSGSEEILGYMAGMEGVSPDGDDEGYAESVI